MFQVPHLPSVLSPPVLLRKVKGAGQANGGQISSNRKGLPSTIFSMKSGTGFTMIEMMIAIFILVVGITGAYIAFSRTISILPIISSRFTAAYLGQEGIELVRNIRDTNWINDRGWNQGLAGGEWEADYQSQTLDDDYDGDYLNIDSNNFYSYSPGTPTKFKRKITITSEGNDILKIIVLINWEEKGKPYQFEIEEYLYNWH